MTFLHTPERLLGRSDSKNPATTCKGITTSGRPCRRELAALKARRNGGDFDDDEGGVLAVVEVDDSGEGAGAFFCWQHKDQAESLITADTVPGEEPTTIVPLRERNSIDTLFGKLGVLAEGTPPPQRLREERYQRESRRRPSRRPPTWEKIQGPLIAVPGDVMAAGAQHIQPQSSEARNEKGNDRAKKKPGFWASLCCAVTVDEDYVEVVRHRKRREDSNRPEASTTLPFAAYVAQKDSLQPVRADRDASDHYGRRPSQGVSRDQSSYEQRPALKINVPPTRKALAPKAARPSNKQSPPSETTRLLSLIPKSLSPTTTSLLLAELSKPISPHDDHGYIYMFWLTDSDKVPDEEAANLLLPQSSKAGNRRPSDSLRDYRSRKDIASNVPPGKKTVLLKIGRASNVHRRMSEWNRQCGYNLSLVRFYPYVSSSPSPSTNKPSLQPTPNDTREQHQHRRLSDLGPGTTQGQVRRVPHVHRVERLIHIELGDKRVKQSCDTCGKEHREWFEVEASGDGVRTVDEVIRRWVSWAENRDV
ncbi:DUF1766-domain-containing protein [Patellaria atrata CBS 101060]|uniref:DUF1766-domain-containing protein n=1 Tax=Patellaria atrata CBS 101060 TaxID=1346257 RepID=A0A9P4VTE5_9PEZI|nr:DUF1766-domain-containing protein [Patellaria atrata CBS 101060]